jgi:hypothetical protein
MLMYSDTQAFGIAAIFNMIQDLKLYRIVISKSSEYGFITDLSRYQLATIMAAIGSLAVSIALNHSCLVIFLINKSYFRLFTLFSALRKNYLWESSPPS